MDTKNRKPLLKKNKETGEMVAGFIEDGNFKIVRSILSDDDITTFLDEYDICVVPIKEVSQF